MRQQADRLHHTPPFMPGRKWGEPWPSHTRGGGSSRRQPCPAALTVTAAPLTWFDSPHLGCAPQGEQGHLSPPHRQGPGGSRKGVWLAQSPSPRAIPLQWSLGAGRTEAQGPSSTDPRPSPSGTQGATLPVQSGAHPAGVRAPVDRRYCSLSSAPCQRVDRQGRAGRLQ